MTWKTRFIIYSGKENQYFGDSFSLEQGTMEATELCTLRENKIDDTDEQTDNCGGEKTSKETSMNNVRNTELGF